MADSPLITDLRQQNVYRFAILRQPDDYRFTRGAGHLKSLRSRGKAPVAAL